MTAFRLPLIWALMTFIYALGIGWLLTLAGFRMPEVAMFCVVAGFFWRELWPMLMRSLLRRSRRKVGWS